MNDIITTMFNKKFLEELFKPQELYSKKALRTVFDRLAHASIMRLNQASMDKVSHCVYTLSPYVLTAFFLLLFIFLLFIQKPNKWQIEFLVTLSKQSINALYIYENNYKHLKKVLKQWIEFICKLLQLAPPAVYLALMA